MWEDAAPHRYPHPSFVIDTEEDQASIYDTFLVDSLDLQSLSLNYPPIKPERREDRDSDPSSSTSSPTPHTYHHSPPTNTNNMHPAWFASSGRGDQSPETQVQDDSFPSSIHPNEDRLPTYNDLYNLGRPSAGIQNCTGDPGYDVPIEGGGLDFSLWERDDPERDACLAAVSSTSREFDELSEGDRGYMQDGGEGKDCSEGSGGTGRLVDLGFDDGDTQYPIPPPLPQNHNPNSEYLDYPSSLSSFPPLTPSRPSESYHPPQAERNNGNSATQFDPFSNTEDDMSSYLSVSETSKRKYDDEEEVDMYDIGLGPSTQAVWKRQRMGEAPSDEEGGHQIRQEDEWQTEESSIPISTSEAHTDELRETDGNPMETSDTSSNAEQRRDESYITGDEGQEWPSDGITVVNDPNIDWEDHDQDDAEQTSQQSLDHPTITVSHIDWQDQERPVVGRQLEATLPLSDDAMVYVSEVDSSERQASSPQAGDGLTDSSVLYSQTQPVEEVVQNSQQSDEIMESQQIPNQMPQSPIGFQAPVLRTQEEVEMTFEPQSLDSVASPSRPNTSQTIQSRKRPAEEAQRPQSPIHKRSRRPPSKIVLAKALPKPPAQTPTIPTPQSSPTLSKYNFGYETIPTPQSSPTLSKYNLRRPWNSSPNRPSSSEPAAAKKEVVLDKGPAEFFASYKATKRSSKIKQKAFKSPLAGGGGGCGGVVLKSKDPNPSNNINYGHAQSNTASSSISVSARIATLEKEARTLRQAVKYQTEQEEDERLQHLIIQWRTAGRDVVEQIFDRVPKPTEGEDEPNTSNSNPWMHGSSGGGVELTIEQERWLKDCRKNEDGEPIDDEGNTLLPKPNSRDLVNLIAEESKGRRGEKEGYYPRYEHDSTGRSKPVQAEAREWNMGTMMLKMSVDPTLLGWDDDLEDWVDTDSL